MQNGRWQIYLSGEIHTDWRDRIAEGAGTRNLPVDFTSAVTVHADSDDCGVNILGEESNGFWKDHKGAKVNAIRIGQLRQANRLPTKETKNTHAIISPSVIAETIG